MIAEEKFRPYQEEVDIEELAQEDEGYWRSSIKLFLKDKVGVFSLILLGVIILFCLFGKYLQPYEVNEQNTAIKNMTPCAEHWFGTDQLGRDIFVRVSHGGIVSIQIGIAVALIVSGLGILYGGISGYIGGVTDIIMMRILEIFKGIPHLVIVILFTIILDVKGILPLLIAMTVSGWMNTAQIVRGQVRQLREREFILASECFGASAMRVLMKHIIPNMMGIIIVTITLDIPTFIFEEAFLSFIGLGLKNPAISWGILISLAQPNLVHEPYQTLFPALAISVTMIAFHMFGNALRDAFDPRIRR